MSLLLKALHSSFVQVVGVMAAIQACGTAQVGWVQAATNGVSADPFHAMAHDSQRGRTVLFSCGVSSNRRDTMEWDGSAWTQMSTTGPAARNYHAMAYDSQRGRTVLFGGTGYATSFLGDTWEWNGSTWMQVAAAAAGPGGRHQHSMVYDSQRGRTVCFGGWNGSSYQGDTWEWNGSAWTPVASGGPSPRSEQALSYDSQRGRTVLFGGYNFNNGLLGDTWEWNGSIWSPQLFAAGPAARRGHAMAYDSNRGRTVMFGGSVIGYALADTQEWDGINWTQVASGGPPARSGHGLAYDSQRARTVLAGGGHNDTWERNGGYGSANSFGGGCGLSLSPIAGARPIINTTPQAMLAGIPSAVAFVALGWSRTSFGQFTLPLTLVGYGMPGCYILQSCEQAALPTVSTGASSATFSLPLPNWAGLVGLHLHVQGWAPAPGANAGNTIVSNGIEWVIGNS